MEQDLILLKDKTSGSKEIHNTSVSQKQAIKMLRDNCDIVIRKADKGGTVVVLDSELYCRQVLNILNDRDTYRVLQNDPTPTFAEKLDHLLQEGLSVNAISQKDKNIYFHLVQ